MVPVRIVAWCCLFLAAVPVARASTFPLQSADRPRFLANVAAVARAGNGVQVDVSWEIPYSQLVFHRDGDWFRARYDVSVVFLRDGRQVDGDVWNRRVRVRSFGETQGAELRATGRKQMKLPPGVYDVRVTVTDRGSRGESDVEGTLDATLRASSLGLGDLRVVHREGGTSVADPAHEIAGGAAGYAVQVNVQPDGKSAQPVRLEWRIRDPARDTVARGDTTVVADPQGTVVEIPIPTDDLSVGDHEMEVRITGAKDESDRRTARLHVRLTTRWFETHRKEALEVFEVLAGDEGIESLRQAGEGEWSQRVAEFWAARDPSRGTERNEYREQVMSRMQTAATLFVEPFRSPGWRTDRGRVLLQYGPPARRAVQLGGFEQLASELWEYDSPRRVFLFVDERGSGEYWLQG